VVDSSPGLPELSHRGRRILYAAITEFIASGEPVGSRTLAKKYGLDLSAASIRNVLADLEEAGYLTQPHTSAGRIPTDQAFRFFIDTLMQVRPLSSEEHTAIEQRFRQVGPGGELLRSTGRILSELTGATAVVASPRPETRTLQQLRFIPTRPGELLAVLVMSDGSVENRFVWLEGMMTEVDIGRIHEMLADVIEGRTLSEVREMCARRLNDDKVFYNNLRRQAFDLGRQAVEGVGRTELLIEGSARLFEHPEMADVERLRSLMAALEDHEKLLTLLDRTVTAERASVLVGHEAGNLAGGSLSIVAAPYLDNGRVAGAIGILGVVRMDYSKVVPVVTATAKAMTAVLERINAASGSSLASVPGGPLGSPPPRREGSSDPQRGGT
jgi:heat-inducible transcriptional repressor